MSEPNQNTFDEKLSDLKRKEWQLQVILDNAPDAVFFKDLQHRFTLVNRGCARGLGMKEPEEVYGKTVMDIFSHEYARQAIKDEQGIIESGKSIIEVEERQVMPDGSEKWVLTTKMPLRDHQGSIVGTFGVSRDISKLKEAHLRLESIMDNIPDPIYFKDRESRFTMINKAAAQTFRLSKVEDAIGKTDFDIFSLDHAQPAFDDEMRILKTGKPLVGFEELETWEDGTTRWISTTKLPLKNYNGEIIGTFGLSRNIDRLKRAEEQLQKHNEILEEKVAQRTAELREAISGLRTRVSQLDYLRRKSHYFTQIIDRDTLLPAIFDSFTELIPDGEIHLCDWVSGAFQTACCTKGLQKAEILGPCKKALDFLDIGNDDNLYFESCWMNNVSLKDLIHTSLRNLPCYIVIPLITDRKLRGVVQVFAPESYKERYTQEYTVLNTLASQSAMSLDNANNYRQLTVRARIQSELDIAHGIQKRFLPEADPVISFLNIKGICRPASEVGGDYLDYFQNTLGEWVFVIADVCGKGVPAGLWMTSLRSSIRTVARDQNSSKIILDTVNKLMRKDLQAGNSFITCTVIIFNQDGSGMNFSRAGHPLMVAFSKEDEPREIFSRGIALGLIPEKDFSRITQEVRVTLKSGDKFLAYSDGLNEAMDQSGKTYGTNRLLKLLDKNRSHPPEELVRIVLKDVEEFCDGHPQSDDLTFFIMEKL